MMTTANDKRLSKGYTAVVMCDIDGTKKHVQQGNINNNNNNNCHRRRHRGTVAVGKVRKLWNFSRPASATPPPSPPTVRPPSLVTSSGGRHLVPAAAVAASSWKSDDRSASSVVPSPYVVFESEVLVLADMDHWDPSPRSRRTVGYAVPEDATTTNSPPGSISNAVIGLAGVNSDTSWPANTVTTGQ